MGTDRNRLEVFSKIIDTMNIYQIYVTREEVDVLNATLIFAMEELEKKKDERKLYCDLLPYFQSLLKSMTLAKMKYFDKE